MNLITRQVSLPKISIVTPSYNHAEHLEDCIDSILSQGYGNLEYIIVDGGSTDASLDIIKKHERHLKHWQSKPDGGLFDAITAGFKHATGDILAYLNSDDFYQPGAFEKVRQIFQSRKDVQWLTGRGNTSDKHGTIIRVEPLLQWPTTAILNVAMQEAGHFIQQDSTFWTADLWRAAGGYTSTAYPLSADYELWVRFARHADLHMVDDLLSSYRYHGDNVAMAYKQHYLWESCVIAIRELQRSSGELLDQKQTAPEIIQTRCKVQIPPGAVRASATEQAKKKPAPGQAVASWLMQVNQEVLSRVETKMAFASNASTAEFMKLYQADASAIKLVTFDIFDTLVLRHFKTPTRLFALLGLELEKKQLLKDGITGRDFRQLRIEAEARARRNAFRKRSSTEVTLKEIYHELEQVITDQDAALAIELEGEARYCYLNEHTVRLLKWFHDQGVRTALVTDSYLTRAQLQSLLESTGFDCAKVDRFYISCEAGVPKEGGRLFQVLLQEEGLLGCEVLHLGDHPLYDIQSSGKAGITAVRYGADERIEKIFEREKRLLDEANLAFCPESFRISSQTVCEKTFAKDRACFQDGAVLFGPVMALFADWCVSQFKAQGIKRVWCLMREGEILKQLLDNSARSQGLELVTVPFYVSRMACLLPSLSRVDLDSLRAKKLTRGCPTVQSFLARYGVEASQVGLDRAVASREVSQSGSQEDLLDFLCREDIRVAVSRKAAEQRQLLEQYIRQSAGDDSRIAVVDVGWRGNIQRDLLNVIHQGSLKLDLVGFYLATATEAADAALDGMKLKGFLCNLGSRQERMASVVYHPEIMEHVLSSSCGSTIGYQATAHGRSEPVLGPASVDERGRRHRQCLWDGMLRFQEEWLKHGQRQSRTLQALVGEETYQEIVSGYAAGILSRLWSYPLKAEAERYGSFLHEANNGIDDREEICTKDNRQRFKEKGYEDMLAGLPYWPQGIIALEREEMINQMFEHWKMLQS